MQAKIIVLLLLVFLAGCGGLFGDRCSSITADQDHGDVMSPIVINKLIVFLVITGIVGLGAGIMLQRIVLLAVPAACGAGVVGLIFLAKFGEWLAWGMLGVVILLLILLIRHYKDVAMYAVSYAQALKTKAVDDVNVTARLIQPASVKAEITKLKKG